MLVSMIAAFGDDRVIGVDNRLPWRLPADMRRFRRVTMGKPVVMGRRTHESIGKALPGRLNVVLSRHAGARHAGCVVVDGIDAALAACGDAPEAIVIGGAKLYAVAMPRARRLYLTVVHERFAGDSYFPAWDEREWRTTAEERFARDAENPHAYTFLTLERVD